MHIGPIAHNKKSFLEFKTRFTFVGHPVHKQDACCTTDKNHQKNTYFFLNFLNMRIATELFAHFDKNVFILRKNEGKNGIFLHF